MGIGYDIVIRLQCKSPFAEFKQMKFVGGILMKRVFAFMLTFVVCLSLSACDGGSSASIEPTIWVMSSIQRAVKRTANPYQYIGSHIFTTVELSDGVIAYMCQFNQVFFLHISVK